MSEGRQVTAYIMNKERNELISSICSPLVDPEGEPICVIIYHDNKPHSVFSRAKWANVYDFEWCENDQICAYHNSGSGGLPYLNKYVQRRPPVLKIWVRPGTQLVGNHDWPKRKKFSAKSARRKLARWGMKLIDSPVLLQSALGMTGNPFEWDLAGHGSAEYCTECEMFHYDDGYGDGQLCEHVGFCEEHGMRNGKGCSDGCDCWENAEVRDGGGEA